MDPILLMLYSYPYQKMRLGKDNDGGYVIIDIPDIKYDILISGGIDNDISFEEDFCKKYHTKCIAFDGTIDTIDNIDNTKFKNKDIELIKKNININNNLDYLLKSYSNIFIKMDIEGSEFEWIRSIDKNNFNNIIQMVIEFHYPSEKDSDVFKKINENFLLVHFHSNNFCGYRSYNEIIIPNVFECTYINKKYIQMNNISLNNQVLPTKYDMKNIPEYDDYIINYPPFVFSQSF